jgi:hypothetical protein
VWLRRFRFSTTSEAEQRLKRAHLNSVHRKQALNRVRMKCLVCKRKAFGKPPFKVCIIQVASVWRDYSISELSVERAKLVYSKMQLPLGRRSFLHDLIVPRKSQCTLRLRTWQSR